MDLVVGRLRVDQLVAFPTDLNITTRYGSAEVQAVGIHLLQEVQDVTVEIAHFTDAVGW